MKNRFAPIAEKLVAHKDTILEELNNAQGLAVNIGGYFHIDDSLAEKAMRPSSTLNSLIATI